MGVKAEVKRKEGIAVHFMGKKKFDDLPQKAQEVIKKMVRLAQKQFSQNDR